MPSFLFTTTARWIGAALLVLAILAGVYAKGRHDVQVKFDAYKAEVKAVAAAQEEKTRQIEAKNERLFKETQNAYNTKLNALRAYYSMRIAGKGGSGLPQVPIATSGVTQLSADQLPPVATLAAQCAETTLTLTALQDWVKNVATNME